MSKEKVILAYSGGLDTSVATVGDPFKDTAGPSINTLITVMSLVASTFAPIIANFNLPNLLK